jgi:hypothetical protein
LLQDQFQALLEKAYKNRFRKEIENLSKKIEGTDILHFRLENSLTKINGWVEK